MNLYATGDEERIHAAAQVREWTRSGLLDTSQGATLEAGLRTDLKRTNRYLRIALFIFGTIVVVATVRILDGGVRCLARISGRVVGDRRRVVFGVLANSSSGNSSSIASASKRPSPCGRWRCWPSEPPSHAIRPR
jgi:hypothetical protein